MDGRTKRFSANNCGFGMGRAAMAGAALVIFCLAGVGLGQQAMGKISIDGPSPLPVTPAHVPEVVKGPMAAGPEALVPPNSGLVAATPATPTTPVMPAAGAPKVDLTARVPLPLPPAAGSTPNATPNATPAPAPSAVFVPAPAAVPAATAGTPEPRALVMPPGAAGPVAGGSVGGSPGGLEGPVAPVTPVKSAIETSPIGGRVADGTKDGGAGAEGAKASGLPIAGFGQVIAALAIVLGLIFIGRALVKRFVPGAKGGSGKGVIEILARHPLAKNQSLVLVRIGSQIVALNQGRDASQSVLVISDQMEVAKIIGQIEGKNPSSSQAGFNKLLANARIDLEESGTDETDLKAMSGENLDEQLEEMAAAKRQLMELRQHVRTVRDRLPRE